MRLAFLVLHTGFHHLDYSSTWIQLITLLPSSLSTDSITGSDTCSSLNKSWTLVASDSGFEDVKLVVVFSNVNRSRSSFQENFATEELSEVRFPVLVTNSGAVRSFLI